MVLFLFARSTLFLLLPAMLSLVFFSCANEGQNTVPPARTTPGDSLSNARAPATYGAATQLNEQGSAALARGDYAGAIAFYQQALEIAAECSDSTFYYDTKLDIACAHDRFGNHDKAIEIGREVLQAFTRMQDTLRIGNTCATLSAFYGAAQRISESIETAKRGIDILRHHPEPIRRSAAYNQLAFTYVDLGKWADALPYFDTALIYMQAAKEQEYLPTLQLNLGDCFSNLKQWKTAESYLGAAVAGADSLDQLHIKAQALLRLSELAEATDRPVAALNYYKRSTDIKNSIFTKEKAETLQTLEITYQTREKEQKIQLLIANKKTQKAEYNLLLAGFVLLLLLLGFGLFMLYEKLRNTRRKMERNKEAFNDYIQLLLQKNAQLKVWEQNIQHIMQKSFRHVDEQKQNKTDAQTLNEQPESLYNSHILTDQDWESFKRRFEQLLPGYLQRLRARFPDLSGAEERLFLLLKVNLNSQEIAGILGITANGVKKARQRLRKRLSLHHEDDLEQFVRMF